MIRLSLHICIRIRKRYLCIFLVFLFQSIILYSSLINSAIEGCGIERIKFLYNEINKLDPYSREYDALSTLVLGKSIELNFDTEGRIVLPEELIEYAEIQDQACFVGKGDIFEIWQPEKFKIHIDELRNSAKNNRYSLRMNGGK